MEAMLGKHLLIGLAELPLVDEVALVERERRGDCPHVRRHRVANVEGLVERLATRAVDDVDQAVRAADVTRVDVARAVAPLEVPHHQRDSFATHHDFLLVNLDADRRQVTRREDRMHETLDEAAFPRRKDTDHADLFLHHQRSLLLRSRADTAISNDTLRLMRARWALSGASSGRAVARAISRKCSARTPAPARIARTRSIRHWAKDAFLSLVPVGSVLPSS